MKQMIKNTARILILALLPVLSTFAAQTRQTDTPATSTQSPHGQSPVDLTNPYVIDLKDIEFHYPKIVNVEVVNKGHTIQANVTTPNVFIILDGKRYDLLQFHTHTPSEHNINHKRHDLELHFVHKNAKSGNYAAIGIMATLDKKNAVSSLAGAQPPIQSLTKDQALANFINILTAAPGTPAHEAAAAVTGTEEKKHDHKDVVLGKTTLNLLRIFPKDKRRFRYPGSFTTAPYSEVVDWNVIAQPIIVTKTLVDNLIRLTVPNNARDVQPINNRPIILDATIDKSSTNLTTKAPHAKKPHAKKPHART